MNSDFFYLPYWQQQLLLFLLMLLLSLLGYFYFISDVKSAAEQQKLIYQESLAKIELRQIQLAKELSKPFSSLNLISENNLAQLLLSYKLALQRFQYQQTEDKSLWNITLQGFYVDFVTLINKLINDDDTINLESLSISKTENEQLLFVLTLSVKKGTDEER